MAVHVQRVILRNRRRSAQLFALVVPLIAILASCESSSVLASLGNCDPQATTANATLPLFTRPFEGERSVTNLFDHDLPLIFADGNDHQLSTCGQRLKSSISGHNGYDWPMPVGTQLFSVSEGRVVLAGREPPFNCPPRGETVSGLVIVIRVYVSPTDSLDAIYGHVDRVDVALNDTVHARQPIGASGNSGCSLEPHLHFSAARLLGSRGEVMIDPYGWNSTEPDPWARDQRGAPSAWLWLDGEAPRLFR